MAKRRKDGPVLRVAELFAGVGGFRLGLERASGEEGAFEVVFSNQWEPGRKRQYASDTYVARFGAKHHVNADIAGIDVKVIPDHDLLVGGFPCQDYSVASTLRNCPMMHVGLSAPASVLMMLWGAPRRSRAKTITA